MKGSVQRDNVITGRVAYAKPSVPQYYCLTYNVHLKSINHIEQVSISSVLSHLPLLRTTEKIKSSTLQRYIALRATRVIEIPPASVMLQQKTHNKQTAERSLMSVLLGACHGSLQPQLKP